MSNRDIAEQLFLSTGTVKWYLSQVYSKFGVSSRTQAVAYARERGLISG
jgi:LuxR family maltose regulon positive regulatory protein